MNKAFDTFLWENYPKTETPLGKNLLNKVNTAVDIIDNRVISHDTTKFNVSEAQLLVKNVTLNEENGVLTITYYNGTSTTYSSLLGKLAVNFDFNEETQKIMIRLSNGEQKEVDLSAFITEYEFVNTGTIGFQTSADGKVSAIVKEGSIQEKHLRPDYLADVKVEVSKASSSAATASSKATAAANSASAAKTSETKAKESETNAAASASTASIKAGEASNSAANAAGSATTATQKAEAAGTSATNAGNSAKNASSSAATATSSANAASASANTAAAKASEALESAAQAESYAVGTGGARPDETTKNAKYYYEQAKSISESFSGALRPMGTVTFANLPALSEAVEGDMYNVSNQFTTNTNFKEGSGYTVPAGSNVYKTADGKWDILAGTPVTGVKGNTENIYRKGNVNITPANIGAPSNEYISEHFVPDYVCSARSAVANQGWYRIAESVQYGYNSCVISLKRSYNSPSPEYQKVQLLSAYTSQKFVCLAAFSNTHLWTKIRETWDEANSKAYIEVYQDRNTYSNAWQVTIEDALSGANPEWRWKTIQPVLTQETVSGVTVLASLDLPANFAMDSLAKKDGSNVSGTWANLTVGAAAKATRDSEGNVIKESYAAKNTIAEGDFNDIISPGFYNMKYTKANKPDTHNGYGLLVINTNGDGSGERYITQMAFVYDNNDIYVRHGCFYTKSWSSWKKIYVEGDFHEKLGIKNEIVNLIYPVGSIYMSVSATSPSTLFGGTWVRWGNGRVPVGIDASQTEFNTLEKTGGSKYLQKHKHTTADASMGFLGYGSGGTIARIHVQNSGTSDYIAFTARDVNDLGYSKMTADAGTGGSENLQPYITCYMWKRTQ